MKQQPLLHTATSASALIDSHYLPDSPVPSSFMSGPCVDLETARVHELFETQVTRTPEAIAVELDGHTLTYQQLNERANRLAHYLRGRGVGPNVLVGVSLERSFDLVVAVYGVLKAGGAYVPLDPTYPLDRLHNMAAAANLHCLITHSKGARIYSGLKDLDIILLDDSPSLLDDECAISASNPEPLDRDASGNPIIYVIFTSGSTGQPKAAAVYHAGFTNLVQWFVKEFGIAHRDKALLISSLSFDLTQKNLFATLISGGTLHLYPPGPYDLSLLSQLINEHQITLVNCTPSAFYPLIEPFDEKMASTIDSLRIVFLGGEPISIPRIKPWLTHPTCIAEVANTYGPTECTDICGFYRLTRDNLEKYDFVPLGRPVFNVQMAILNSDMNPCQIGESGELCVGGAGVGAGYINDAEMTREKFVANPLPAVMPTVKGDLIYRTGDQARWHADGVIEFLGRLDHQVKIRGFRIELPEIERAVEAHPAVSESIVIVKSDSSPGEPQLACCFTTQMTTERRDSVSVAELRSHLSDKLPAHMIPGLFEEFSTFPLSPNGKVDRKALTELVRQRHPSPALTPPKAPPKSIGSSGSMTGIELEEQIHAAWCHLLDCPQASFDETFFDLGGDSLQLARLHQNLEALLDRKIPITDLFTHPTIRSMAKHFGSPPMKVNNKQDKLRERARRQREAQSAKAAQRNRR